MTTVRSLRVELTLWFLALFAVALLLFLLADLGFRDWERLDAADERLNLLEGRIAQAWHGLEDRHPERFDAILRGILAGHSTYAAFWPDCREIGQRKDFFSGTWTARPLFREPELPPIQFLTSTQKETKTLSSPHLGRLARLSYRTLPRSQQQPSACLMLVLLPDELPADTGQTLPWRIALVLLLLGVTGLAVAAVLGKAFVHVRDAATLAERISEKDLSLRLDESRAHGEFRELLTTINGMLDRLEASFLRVRRFSGDAAHELKTPLSTLLGELDLALRRERTPEEYRTILLRQHENLSSLARLVDNLLLLSSLDEAHVPLEKKRVAVDDLCLSACETVFPLARERKVSLHVPEPTGLSVSGNAALLERLLVNLLENAVKYSEPGSEVFLEVLLKNERIRLEVRDRGCGIATAEQSKVWDRFHRVDGSRARATGGFGLGLSLVRSIAVAHGATLELQSEPGHGTSVRVGLPRELG